MQKLNDILNNIDGLIGGSQWFVFLLLGVGLFFTLYLRFPQFRYMGHALKVVKGKFDKKDDIVVESLKVNEFCEENGKMPFFETSAKDDLGIGKAFEEIVRLSAI